MEELYLYKVTIDLVGFGNREGINRTIRFGVPDLKSATKALYKRLKRIRRNPNWFCVARAVIEMVEW